MPCPKTAMELLHIGPHNYFEWQMTILHSPKTGYVPRHLPIQDANIWSQFNVYDLWKENTKASISVILRTERSGHQARALMNGHIDVQCEHTKLEVVFYYTGVDMASDAAAEELFRILRNWPNINRLRRLTAVREIGV